MVEVPRRFSTVVTTAAGHPLDATYYQTVKGMVVPLQILEKGGEVVIASSCSEGFGSAEYREAQQRYLELGPEGFIDDIRDRPYAAVDAWQTEMQVRTDRVGSVRLFTDGLTESERALTGVDVVPSIEDAVRASVERSGDTAVAVIPEGPYIVPVFKPATSSGVSS